MENKPIINSNFAMAMNYYKTLRKKNNKDIADALQLPATTISAWNTGRHLPDMGRLQKLASYLEAPIEQFFYFSPKRNIDNEIQQLHNLIDTNEELVQHLKNFLQLSDENKQLLTLLMLKIKN